MKKAFVCLGSNMGDSEACLERARQALEALEGVVCERSSSLYRTEPQGRKDQPWFLNQVLMLACDGIGPDQLLKAMLEIEDHIGRKRDAADRFGPRVIDLDLLMFGDCVREGDPFLILPHPRMHERAFVLVPLLEIAPDVCLPDGTPCSDLLEKIPCRLEGNDIYQ